MSRYLYILTSNSLNILFQYIILTIQFFILIIPFLGKAALYDKRKKILKRFSARGYTLIVLATLLIVSTIIQNQIVDNINRVKDEKFQNAITIRDSINQSKNEGEAFKTKEMLARYGYKVDSTNKQIVKTLRDSSLRKTTIINGDAPFLTTCDMHVKRDDSTALKIMYSLCSKDAASYNIAIQRDVFALNPKENIYSIISVGDFLFLPNTSFPKEEGVTASFDISKPDMKNRVYYFRIYGTYYKSDNTPIGIDKFFSYDLIDKQFGFPGPFVELQLRQLLDEHSNKK